MFASAVSQSYRSAGFNAAFAADVSKGLGGTGQKALPASWLYDGVGSALFEAITLLPEYGLTRADGALLQSIAHELVNDAQQPEFVVELGSGSGTKTRHILSAATQFGRVEYLPIDISRTALENCAATLRTLEGVSIEAIEATYLEGIDLALARRHSSERALILFLGSTIGNFTREEAATFLHRVRQRVKPGDSLLLGADLVKPRATLIRAYDDAIGVTAAFNRNLLARMNRELDAEFDLTKFAHEARYSEREARIEMHLRSLVSQKVAIGALDFSVSFAAGETIWTESSHKFRAPEVIRVGENAGWRSVHQWTDREWGFSETLFTA